MLMRFGLYEFHLTKKGLGKTNPFCILQTCTHNRISIWHP